MKIYLINMQDRCPENNNGDCIIAAFLNEKNAELYAKWENMKDQEWIHSVQEMNILDAEETEKATES